MAATISIAMASLQEFRLATSPHLVERKILAIRAMFYFLHA
jgi:hypothetical protein